MTVLTNAQTRSTSVLADASAVPNACLFARAVLADWELSVLAEDACSCLGELVFWILTNEPCAVVEVGLMWDGPLLFVEVGDRHESLPWEAEWRLADGGRAVALLDDRALEWSAEETARGRCLWASFHTGYDEVPHEEPR